MYFNTFTLNPVVVLPNQRGMVQDDQSMYKEEVVQHQTSVCICTYNIFPLHPVVVLPNQMGTVPDNQSIYLSQIHIATTRITRFIREFKQLFFYLTDSLSITQTGLEIKIVLNSLYKHLDFDFKEKCMSTSFF